MGFIELQTSRDLISIMNTGLHDDLRALIIKELNFEFKNANALIEDQLHKMYDYCLKKDFTKAKYETWQKAIEKWIKKEIEYRKKNNSGFVKDYDKTPIKHPSFEKFSYSEKQQNEDHNKRIKERDHLNVIQMAGYSSMYELFQARRSNKITKIELENILSGKYCEKTA